MAGIAVILATTNHLILRTGAWFLGHIAFFAIGAFTLLYARSLLGLSYWLAMPLAALITGLVALGFGYATSRVKGIPFCILTVAFVEVVRLTIQRLFSGRPVICQTPEALFSVDFSSRTHYYYFICILVALVLALMRMIDTSRIGANLTLIAENESLAESVGINTVRYRVMLMTVCCGLAGLAGAFFAPYVKVVGETSFNLGASVLILMYIVVGGMGFFWGPVIGAVFLSILPEFMPGRAAIQFIIYALIVLATIFFLPGGVLSLPGIVRQRILRTSRASHQGEST
jgi:branched-chain amino acid transport system permease protein